MEKYDRTRTNKPQRPALHDYIRGAAKLEDMVSKEKIVKRDESRTSKQRTLLATINCIDKNFLSASSSDKSHQRKAYQTSSAKRVYPQFASSSGKLTARKTERKGDQTSSTVTSTSQRSERSAQGDMTEGSVRTFSSSSTKSSVILDRVLNDKEKEIGALKAEIENLKQASNVEREQEIASLLRKLLQDLPSYEPNHVESSDDVDVLADRLHCAMRELRESHQQENTEKEKILESLSKRVEILQSDLQKMSETNEHHVEQLADLRMQNEELQAHLENTQRVLCTSIVMCDELQVPNKDEFRNKIDELENREKTMRERVEQVKQDFGKLESACHRHLEWPEQHPLNQQIEALRTELQERMHQLGELTTCNSELEKRFDELRETNQQLLEEVKLRKKQLMTLSSRDREFRDRLRYLQQRDKALEQACQDALESLPSPLKEKTLAVLHQEILDAETAYTKDMVEHFETIRETRGSSDH